MFANLSTVQVSVIWMGHVVSNRNNSWTHKRAAVICLAAVLLLQVPFAGAAWLSSSMACCMGNHCSVQSHHHKPSAPKVSEMPMDCGHHSNKAPECKMSCCKSTDEAATNVSLFLIPSPQAIRSIERAIPAVSQPVPQTISRSEKPQSPPPRNILA